MNWALPRAPSSSALLRSPRRCAASWRSCTRNGAQKGLPPFRAEFDQHAALTGRFVRMEDLSGNALAAGCVVRTAADGRLCCAPLTAPRSLANSGEAHPLVTFPKTRQATCPFVSFLARGQVA